MIKNDWTQYKVFEDLVGTLVWCEVALHLVDDDNVNNKSKMLSDSDKVWSIADKLGITEKEIKRGIKAWTD